MAAFNKKNTKLIKVSDRGMIMTSRGAVRGPITVPYLETYDQILLMVTRYGYNVFEVLKDGSGLKLDINNFNKDNNKAPEVIPTVPVRKTEPDKELIPTQAINREMSRKERKRLEYERQLAAQKAAKEAQNEMTQQNETKEEQSTPTDENDTDPITPESIDEVDSSSTIEE